MSFSSTPSRTEHVTLDEGSMDLYVWLPESGHGAGVLLIQEIFGVGDYIRDVAARLVEAGYVVAAPDVFWRFSPGWQSAHDEAGLEASIAKVQELDGAKAIADCAAALGVLRDLPETSGQTAALGFCMGGSLAFGVAAAAEPDVCVSYYGAQVPDMLDLIDRVSCPTLFHFGNTDAYLPGEGVERLAKAIEGRSNFTINVENAGHAFDNHHAPMFYDESAAKAAWSKSMAFLENALT